MEVFRARKNFFVHQIMQASTKIKKEKSLETGILKEDSDSDEEDVNVPIEKKCALDEMEQFGFMMTRVRAAFRLKILKESKNMKNKGLLQVAHRMQMDRDNRVDTFEEIGMTNPFKIKTSLRDALSEIKTFDFYTEVYPRSVTGAIFEALKRNENI